MQILRSFSQKVEIGSGFDLSERRCRTAAKCWARLGMKSRLRPFSVLTATAPDIDLNFAGEYQDVRRTGLYQNLVRLRPVFKAGTIATVAEKTAYGYVRKYVEERGLNLTNAEITPAGQRLYRRQTHHRPASRRDGRWSGTGLRLRTLACTAPCRRPEFEIITTPL